MAAAIVVSVSVGVMNSVLEKLAALMSDKYKKIKGLEEKVSNLKCELSYMNSVLEKMEQDADKLDQQDKIWRKDVIEMSYDIEDYIDDFIHRFGEAGDKVGTGILQKAYHYLITFMDRHRLANQFQEIENQVMQASKRRKRYKLDQCISITTPVIVDPRLSAFYKESASLVGIDTQKEELVKWVMDEGQQLKVVSIVGFGGLGKTTLANEVYREVSGKFDCKAFVSISQKPDMRMIHVKYLKIDVFEGSVMLPAKISGLRQLQTLEINCIRVSNIPSDIVDLPCLSHLDLIAHENPCLPDGIGKMKWLRTLRGFSLPSSPENIKGISELTNLADLYLGFDREESGCVPTATWMGALSSSLEKLSNLKCLFLGSSRKAFCADAMSSFSPPFRNIEKLYLRALTLPRVPRWISDLRSLRALDLGVKEITCEDVVGIIGTLPVLARLHLRIPGVPAERIVIGSTVFTVLKWFYFDCDGASCITFEAGECPTFGTSGYKSIRVNGTKLHLSVWSTSQA